MAVVTMTVGCHDVRVEYGHDVDRAAVFCRDCGFAHREAILYRLMEVVLTHAEATIGHYPFLDGVDRRLDNHGLYIREEARNRARRFRFDGL